MRLRDLANLLIIALPTLPMLVYADDLGSTTSEANLFSRTAIERAALRPLVPEYAISVAENAINFSCRAMRARLPIGVQLKLSLWEGLGVLQESECTKFGETDPVAEPTASELLAQKNPPLEIDLLSGYMTMIQEPYPTRRIPVDHLGFPVQEGLCTLPLWPTIRCFSFSAKPPSSYSTFFRTIGR